MKLVLKIVFIIFILWMCIGLFLLKTEHPKAEIVMGLGVFYLSFLLMPILFTTDIKMVNTKNIN